MTAIAHRPELLPEPSAWLRDALAHVAAPHPDIGLEPARIRPGVREEAARRAETMAAQLAPASAEQWQRFLLPMRVLPNAPLAEREYAAAVGTIAFALHDIPASVLTANRQREALRALRFWPTPNDLAAILSPAANALRSEHRALRTIAAAPEATTSAPPTEAERAANAARAQALAAHLRGDASGTPRARGGSRPLSPAALIAGYEAAGTPAALYRAEVLRRQHVDIPG